MSKVTLHRPSAIAGPTQRNKSQRNKDSKAQAHALLTVANILAAQGCSATAEGARASPEGDHEGQQLVGWQQLGCEARPHRG